MKKIADSVKGKGPNVTSGLDLKTLLEEGAKVAGYYIGKGAVKFADFAKKVYEDLKAYGENVVEAVKPYLRKIYDSAMEKLSQKENSGNKEETNRIDDTTTSLPAIKKRLQHKILSWLNGANIDWAKGKSLKDCSSKFGNKPEPIAVLPSIVRRNIKSLQNDYLYSGKAYLIDHQANHHPELAVKDYDKIQTILDNYDDIKDVSIEGGPQTFAFIKKLDKGYAVVVEVSAEDGKTVFHKSFFYRDGNGKRVPYKNKKSVLNEWSEDGSTSISPTVSQQPADTESISALDHSVGKDKQSVSNEQGKSTQSGENAEDKTDKSDRSDKSNTTDTTADVSGNDDVQYMFAGLEGATRADEATEEQYRLGEAVTEILKKARIELSTNVEEMRKVILDGKYSIRQGCLLLEKRHNLYATRLKQERPEARCV